MSKIATLHAPEEGLSAELRSFLDRVVVPALVRKYIEEVTPAEKPLAPASGAAAYSLGQRSPRRARGGTAVE
ncbi:MAG: hypothetical protein WB630_11985 [Candidatus Acidiferrales bacterium]